MIDNPEKANHLTSEMESALPLETRLSPDVIDALAGQSPDIEIPARCKVVKIFYTGDEGGIVCGLNIGGADGTRTPLVVSITYLTFDRRCSLFRQIDAYQRHRVKKLKQQSLRGY